MARGGCAVFPVASPKRVVRGCAACLCNDVCSYFIEKMSLFFYLRPSRQVAGALERLRRGETSVIALLQGVSAASARIIAEVIFLTQSPDLLSEPPPLTAPFMQHYAGAVVMDSDVDGLAVLLDAGLSADLAVQVSNVCVSSVSTRIYLFCVCAFVSRLSVCLGRTVCMSFSVFQRMNLQAFSLSPNHTGLGC